MLVLRAAPFLTLVFMILSLNPLNQFKEERKILPPLEGAEYFHFGFKEITADLLWLNFIQHSFDCSVYKDPEGKICPDRWGYRTLLEVSKLSPQFNSLYKFGAVKLTVLLNDHQGAAELFEKGLKYFNKDWIINYRASYLYMEELKNFTRAAELLESAALYGAPKWTKSLASRMYHKSGQLELSHRLLLDLYSEAAEGAWKESLKQRIQKLREQLRNV